MSRMPEYTADATVPARELHAAMFDATVQARRTANELGGTARTNELQKGWGLAEAVALTSKLAGQERVTAGDVWRAACDVVKREQHREALARAMEEPGGFVPTPAADDHPRF